MKSKFRSFYSKILSACLVLLGFNACDILDDEHNTRAEYGTPSASYKVLGTVVSSGEEKNPVENIRVVMVQDVDEENVSYLYGDTVFTDASGRFELNYQNEIYNQFKIKIQDVDGIENGYFEDVEQVIEFKNSDYKGGDGSWYRGEAQKDMGTIEMNPKQ